VSPEVEAYNFQKADRLTNMKKKTLALAPAAVQREISRTGLQDHNIPLKNSAAGKEEYDMIVFSHIRWEYLYQRPQHIISRLSASKKTLFVEEPVEFEPAEENTAKITQLGPNLKVLQPRVKNIAEIEKVLSRYASTVNRPIAWFYSAAFSVLLGSMEFSKIIYDCIDERTLFRVGSAQSAMEKYLLSEANIVFAGGKSLFEALQPKHNNVHCFPGSVDREHFAKALCGLPVPADIKRLRRPVIGYYGAIDERIDLKLLGELAYRNPQASFVMIGPLEKVTKEQLLKHDNIYYLGVKPYNLLPNYLRAFDIAMMPFAMNEATLYLSPAKTLEYIAAGKPVISTPVFDIARDYKHCISIVSGSNEFSFAIKELMLEHPYEKEQRLEKYKQILDRTSWDNTAYLMERIIKLRW
jgi:glycosyltransferase involved in cell wall biosynthesis